MYGYFIVAETVVGIAAIVAGAALQQGMPEGTLSWLIQIPVVAAFIWFTLQLAKMQQLQVSSCQDTMNKLEEAHHLERKDNTEMWMAWMDQRQALFTAFLESERELRRQQHAEFLTQMAEFEKALESTNIRLADVIGVTSAYREELRKGVTSDKM